MRKEWQIDRFDESAWRFNLKKERTLEFGLYFASSIPTCESNQSQFVMSIKKEREKNEDESTSNHLTSPC